MNQKTNQDVNGMVWRLRGLTNLNLSVGKAYGNHYTLELNNSENTGIQDVGFAIGKGNFYNLVYGMVKIVETMQHHDKSEELPTEVTA